MTEMRSSTSPPWVPPAVLMGMISGGLYFPTHYVPFGATAAVLFLAAGISGISAVVHPPKPQQVTAAGGSIVGVTIRHSGGTSVVTADLDYPAQRRCVTALDAHGRSERLLVGLDPDGRVIEAAVPGADWAAAEAV